MRKTREPISIKPELVEIGDLVVVSLQESRGIVMSKRGRVASRVDHNNVRIYKTAEGAILFTWEPGGKKEITLTLIDRTPHESVETLFDLEERMAS